MDISGLGEVQSNQAAANVNIRQTENRNPDERIAEEQAEQEKLQKTQSLRDRRAESLQEVGESSSQKIELERSKTPGVEESAAKETESGFDETGGSLDIQA